MESTSKKQAVHSSMTLGEIVQSHPESVQAMLDHGLHCVGCHVAFSETLEEGARAHGMSDEEIKEMVGEMNKAILEKPAAPAQKEITLTPNALQKIKEIFQEQKKEGHFLRIEAAKENPVDSYSFDFEKAQKPGDKLIEEAGIRILISEKSIPILSGSTIDYVNGIDGEGFRVERER